MSCCASVCYHPRSGLHSRCQAASWRLHLGQIFVFSSVCLTMMKIGLDWWTICIFQNNFAHFSFFLVAFCANLKKEYDLVQRRSISLAEMNFQQQIGAARKKSRSWDAKAIFYHRWFINKDAQGCLSRLASEMHPNPRLAPESVSFLFFSGSEWKFFSSFALYVDAQTNCKAFSSFQTRKINKVFFHKRETPFRLSFSSARHTQLHSTLRFVSVA